MHAFSEGCDQKGTTLEPLSNVPRLSDGCCQCEPFSSFSMVLKPEYLGGVHHSTPSGSPESSSSSSKSEAMEERSSPAWSGCCFARLGAPGPKVPTLSRWAPWRRTSTSQVSHSEAREITDIEKEARPSAEQTACWDVALETAANEPHYVSDLHTCLRHRVSGSKVTPSQCRSKPLRRNNLDKLENRCEKNEDGSSKPKQGCSRSTPLAQVGRVWPQGAKYQVSSLVVWSLL